MFKKIFDYKVIYEANEECFAFGEIEFKKNFGPYKQGNKISFLWFNLETSKCQEFDEDGIKILKEFEFNLTA